MNDGSAAAFANAPAGTLHGHDLGGAGHVRRPRRTARTVGATGTCDGDDHLGDAGDDDDPGDDDVTVGGVSLTRTTGDAHAGDGAERGEELGRREDLDRAERDERGRPAAHVHGDARRQDTRLPASWRAGETVQRSL